MGSSNESNEADGNQSILEKIKSKYILKRILDDLQENKYLEIIKYNKQIQNRLNMDINYYKNKSENFTKIELELSIDKNIGGKYINITNNTDKSYYHIYFENSKEEVNRYDISQHEKVKKIKIIIDGQINSFKELFRECKCIESINFKKFYRTNITDMSFMFYECSSLKKLNFSIFRTDNVVNMNYMFQGCSSLKKLDLYCFNTNNVIKMHGMFFKCESLKYLNVSGFKTNNVTDMASMFFGCTSLKELNISNFNTINVIDLGFMFSNCLSLKRINLPVFNIIKVRDMKFMFDHCSEKVKAQAYMKNLRSEAFSDYMGY